MHLVSDVMDQSLVNNDTACSKLVRYMCSNLEDIQGSAGRAPHVLDPRSGQLYAPASVLLEEETLTQGWG